MTTTTRSRAADRSWQEDPAYMKEIERSRDLLARTETQKLLVEAANQRLEEVRERAVQAQANGDAKAAAHTERELREIDQEAREASLRLQNMLGAQTRLQEDIDAAEYDARAAWGTAIRARYVAILPKLLAAAETLVAFNMEVSSLREATYHEFPGPPQELVIGGRKLPHLGLPVAALLPDELCDRPRTASAFTLWRRELETWLASKYATRDPFAPKEKAK